jgi:hypothetical protein
MTGRCGVGVVCLLTGGGWVSGWVDGGGWVNGWLVWCGVVRFVGDVMRGALPDDRPGSTDGPSLPFPSTT